MAEYTFADVIINPEDPRVEIGKEYYFALGAQACIDYANRDARAASLKAVDTTGKYSPFISDSEKDYPFIIHKKEQSYKELQAEWVKANDLKIGDKVRILRGFSFRENGFEYGYDDNSMDQMIGKTCYVVDITDLCISVNGNDNFLCYRNYPYFVLEKVKTEYVPFDLDNPEVRRELMGKTIINNYGLDGDGEFREVMIVGFMNKSDEDRDCWSSNGDTEGTIAMTVEGYFHADELLTKCTFPDGTPCGKLVEVE